MNTGIKIFGIIILGFALIIGIGLLLEQEPLKDFVDNSQGTLEFKQFANEEELEDYLEKQVEEGEEHNKVFRTLSFDTAQAGIAESSLSADTVGSADYSTTNIQIEGVDEADFIKSDGEYFYLVSGKTLYIVQAYPAEEMNIIAEIDLEGHANQLYLNKDKLIIFGQPTYDYGYDYALPTRALAEPAIVEEAGLADATPEVLTGDVEPIIQDADVAVAKPSALSIAPYPYPSGYQQFIKIYDISDKQSPELTQEIEMDGYYSNSRMIGDHVYVISTKHLYTGNIDVPEYRVNGEVQKIAVNDIYYPTYPSRSYTFTSISAIGLADESFNTETYLLGSSHNIFVSQNNIYLTQQQAFDYNAYLQLLYEEVYQPILPEEQQEQAQKIIEDEEQNYWQKEQALQALLDKHLKGMDPGQTTTLVETLEEGLENIQEKAAKLQRTAIYKISIDKGEINYEATGSVPGYVLNQFSMDEHKGNLRITTTTGGWNSGIWNWGWNRIANPAQENPSMNHLYILDEDLDLIGSVEDLAKGERIYSTRFAGDKAYMVTYRNVDPLFVIDTADPKNPEVLGYLKITGYSNYLHPYDEDHLIGIGQETTLIDEDRAINQGVKVTLFDVSDFENPKEVQTIEIGDRGTNSPAQYDHKAVLFDKEKNLLVIPINLYEIKEENYDTTNPEWRDWAYGSFIWTGAYVFDINEEELKIRGRISHTDQNVGAYEESYYNYWQDNIQRSLYIQEQLYTVSQYKIKASDLETLRETNAVDIGTKPEPYKPVPYEWDEVELPEGVDAVPLDS